MKKANNRRKSLVFGYRPVRLLNYSLHIEAKNGGFWLSAQLFASHAEPGSDESGSDCSRRSGQGVITMRANWKPGDWAVYRKTKRSVSPGRRASQVVASPKGEQYAYVVDKFWVVESVLPDDRLVVLTARGKKHVLESDDPNLRRPGFLQRILWRERFRMVAQQLGERPNYAA